MNVSTFEHIACCRQQKMMTVKCFFACNFQLESVSIIFSLLYSSANFYSYRLSIDNLSCLMQFSCLHSCWVYRVQYKPNWCNWCNNIASDMIERNTIKSQSCEDSLNLLSLFHVTIFWCFNNIPSPFYVSMSSQPPFCWCLLSCHSLKVMPPCFIH